MGRLATIRRRTGAALSWCGSVIEGTRDDYVRSVSRARYGAALELAEGVELAEWSAFRRRLFVRGRLDSHLDGSRVVAIAAIFPDSAVERRVIWRDREFSWVVPLPGGHSPTEVRFGVRCSDGRTFVMSDPPASVATLDRDHGAHARFVEALAKLPGGCVVEIGARARSDRVYRDLVPDCVRYVGVDIVDGPNVDVVGDAHELGTLFAPGSVDVVFSIATFEHLAMPWRCATEINKVLKDGGLCFVLSHQTFPLHEQPWDFFRFSDNAWRALFNDATGFRVLDVELGERAVVTPIALTSASQTMDDAPAYLRSSVACQKIGPSVVEWPVPLAQVVTSVYPG